MWQIIAEMHPYVSLFLFTLVDVLGFSIILPLFPYLTKNIMSPVEVGFLQSSNALAQLVATPLIGALSDKWVPEQETQPSILSIEFHWKLLKILIFEALTLLDMDADLYCLFQSFQHLFHFWFLPMLRRNFGFSSLVFWMDWLVEISL